MISPDNLEYRFARNDRYGTVIMYAAAAWRAEIMIDLSLWETDRNKAEKYAKESARHWFVSEIYGEAIDEIRELRMAIAKGEQPTTLAEMAADIQMMMEDLYNA